MGGGEGEEGDIIGAVMVDTGSAAQEWGRLQQQKKGKTEKSKKADAPIVEQQKKLEEQRQQAIEK